LEVVMPKSVLFLVMLLALVLGGWTQPAHADVAYTEILRAPEVQQGPFQCMRSQVLVGDDAIRRETLPKAKSPYRVHATIIPNLDGLLPSIEILRLDKNVAWSVSPSGQVQSGGLRQVLLGSEPFGEPAKLEALAGLEPESDRAVLRRTGFNKKINGFACVHLFATVTSEVKDRHTGEKGTLVLMSDLWVAQDVPGTSQIRRLQRSLGERLGLEEYFCADAALLAQALPEQAAEIGELVAQVEGLLVSNTFTAKLRRSSRSGDEPTELLYSLTSDLMDVRSVSPDPRRFEPPVSVSVSR
jgi:hypothetical protein